MVSRGSRSGFTGVVFAVRDCYGTVGFAVNVWRHVQLRRYICPCAGKVDGKYWPSILAILLMAHHGCCGVCRHNFAVWWALGRRVSGLAILAKMACLKIILCRANGEYYFSGPFGNGRDIWPGIDEWRGLTNGV
jgi:hypothetical protein